MIPAGEQFPYQQFYPRAGLAGLMPVLQAKLIHERRNISVNALVDSGATYNILPWQLGLDLGFDWEQLSVDLFLGGAFGGLNAKAVVVDLQVGRLPRKDLVFAWAKSNEVPVILGQANFFFEFDVCFHRSEAMFEIRPKA